MESLSKTPRRRVANFTADEKALLAQLIKKKPIIESKLTDGKSVLKKKAAWELLTEEYNCNAHIHKVPFKRDTVTLKRAWDNLKAKTRKIRSNQRGNLNKTGGGPDSPLTSTGSFSNNGRRVSQDKKSSEESTSHEELVDLGVDEVQVEQTRKTADYLRREAVMRINFFEKKKKIEMQILKTQLETAVMERERSKICLEMARMKSEQLKTQLQ